MLTNLPSKLLRSPCSCGSCYAGSVAGNAAEGFRGCSLGGSSRSLLICMDWWLGYIC